MRKLELHTLCDCKEIPFYILKRSNTCFIIRDAFRLTSINVIISKLFLCMPHHMLELTLHLSQTRINLTYMQSFQIAIGCSFEIKL